MTVGKKDFHQSRVSIQEISITSNKTGKKLDIVNMVKDLHIYENLYFPGITGYMDIIDTIDILDKIPIRGEEVIKINFFSNDLEKKMIPESTIDSEFIIYKVDDVKSSESMKILTFRIYFCSAHLIEDKKVKLSMSFGNEQKPILISQMVTDIIRKNLKIPTSKNITVSDTKNPRFFIVPNLTPIQAILHLAQESRQMANSDSNPMSSTFLFFENRFGVYFVPYESILDGVVFKDKQFKPNDLVLLSQPKSKKTNSSTPNDAHSKFIPPDSVSATKFTWKKLFDHHDNSQSGMFGSKIIFHDLLKKSITQNTFDYNINFNDTNKRISSMDKNAESILPNRTGSENEKIFLLPLNKTQDFNMINDTDIDKSPWKNEHVARIQIMNNNVAEVEMGANSRIILGQLINLDFSSIYKHKEIEMFTNKSGKYLVTKIHHHVTPIDTKYFMDLEIRKGNLTAAEPKDKII